MQSKELKNQVVSVQESGVETLKEVKAQGEVFEERCGEMKEEWQRYKGTWEERVAGERWEECVEQKVEEMLEKRQVKEQDKELKAAAAIPMVDITPIKGLEEFKQNEPIMKKNDKGELVSLSEQDKRQLAALGFVLMEEVKTRRRRKSEPSGPVRRLAPMFASPEAKEEKKEVKLQRQQVEGENEARPQGQQGEGKSHQQRANRGQGAVAQVGETQEKQRYPAIVVRGFSSQPDATEFTQIMQKLGVPGIRALKIQVKQQGRSYMMRVLLHEEEHLRQIIKNKRILRGTRYWIDRDGYPKDWEKVLKEESEGKERRRQQERKEAVQRREREKRMEQLRRAPKTEMFKGIYDGIEADAQKQRRGLGNGQRGARGWRQGERRDRAKESNWRTIAL